MFIMKRLVSMVFLFVVCVASLPSHAATTDVRIAGFQYLTGGHVVAEPLGLAGSAGDVTLPNETGVPNVRRGDSIVFTNLDPVPHTVDMYSGDGTGWDGLQIGGAGGSATLSITDDALVFPNGLYVYKCQIHGGMRGAFRVVS